MFKKGGGREEPKHFSRSSATPAGKKIRNTRAEKIDASAECLKMNSVEEQTNVGEPSSVGEPTSFESEIRRSQRQRERMDKKAALDAKLAQQNEIELLRLQKRLSLPSGNIKETEIALPTAVLKEKTVPVGLLQDPMEILHFDYGSNDSLASDDEDLGRDDSTVLQRLAIEREDQVREKEVAYTSGILEASLFDYFSISNHEKRSRAFGRVTQWLTGDTDYRTINSISNSEAENLSKQKFQPNLPQFAATWIDPYLLQIDEQSFTAKVLDQDTGEVRAQVTVKAHYRDPLEALVYRVVANAKAGFGLVGKMYNSCGSLSECHQTPYFELAEQHVRAKYGPNVKICPVDIFSDSAALRNMASDSIQPIILEISGGYGRHFRGSAEDFEKTTIVAGWLPNFREIDVIVKQKGKGKRKDMNGKVPWGKLPQTLDRALTKALLDKIYEHIYDALATAITDRVFDFAYGIGKVVFILASFKGDQPEKNRWSNSIGCQICTEPNEIILGDVCFRSAKNQGRIHEDGFNVLTLGHKFLLAGDPWMLFNPPDLMHTWDNAVNTHFVRLCSLLLCDEEEDKNQIEYKGEFLTVAVKENMLVYVNTKGEVVSVAAAHIEKNSRVNKRVEHAQGSSRWDEICKMALTLGGTQANDFCLQRGSMCDRAYGFTGFILALHKLLPELEDIDDFSKGMLLELADNLYYIQVRMADSGVGFSRDLLLGKFQTCADLWLKLSARTGIAEIPISVHVLFHYPQMILRFGAPLLYSLFREESHHCDLKSDIVNNSNRVRGTTGHDYLSQVLKRAGRKDVCQFWLEKPWDPAAPPRFELKIEALPKDQEKRSRQRNTKPELCQDSIAKLLKLKLLKNPDWRLENSVADQYHYYECAASILNEHFRTVVFPEKIQAICAVGSLDAIRAMACAPDQPEYHQERRAILEKVEACFDRSCFACCELEYGSSLIMNNSSSTADEFYVALGFRKNGHDGVVALALKLDIVSLEHEILYRVEMRSSAAPVEVDMRRFRDSCNLVRLTADQYVVLERLRGRLT